MADEHNTSAEDEEFFDALDEQRADKEEHARLQNELEAIEARITDDRKCPNLAEILATAVDDLDSLKLAKFPHLREKRKHLLRLINELSCLHE